jgi:chorismate mutase
MGPLLLIRLPFLPLRGLVSLAELIRDQAERELRDPAAVRRVLEEAEEARNAGAISESEVARIEREAMNRLYANGGPSAGAGGNGS